MSGKEILRNQTFYLKNDLCKKFYDQNHLFWDIDILIGLSNNSIDGDNLSQVEIFSASKNSYKNGSGNFEHLMTCYNPNMIHSVPNAALNWCATAPSYKEILDEKTITRLEDIGICPGINHLTLIHFLVVYNNENFISYTIDWLYSVIGLETCLF